MWFPKIDMSIEMNGFVNGEIKKVNLAEYKGNNVVLLFYPYDFTFVCPTEINALSDLSEEFKKRNTVVLLISCDSPFCHKAWATQPRNDGGIEGVQWPMLSDIKGKLSTQFGLYYEKENITMRSTVILDDQFNVYNICIHHDNIGRSTDELLRQVDAMIFHKKHGDICPVNWTQ